MYDVNGYFLPQVVHAVNIMESSEGKKLLKCFNWKWSAVLFLVILIYPQSLYRCQRR